MLARVRMATHELRLETGRYNNIEEHDERLCEMRERKDVEDESHFLLACPAYERAQESMWTEISKVVGDWCLKKQEDNNEEQMKFLVTTTSAIRSKQRSTS